LNVYFVGYYSPKLAFMTSRNFLVGGIIAGIAYFFLGWIVYGILLKDFMHANAGTATNVDRAEDQFVWWSLALGNLVLGFLLAYVMDRRKSVSASSGAMTGITVGLLMAAGIDLIIYGTTNLATIKFIAADIAAMAVISGLAGGITGLILGMLNRKAIAAA
jgi:hypothetical protein